MKKDDWVKIFVTGIIGWLTVVGGGGWYFMVFDKLFLAYWLGVPIIFFVIMRISMKYFSESEEQDEIVELKRDELNKKDEEVGELKKANKLKEKELEELESKITQTRDVEEQRRKDKERPATKSLKEEFEKFLLYWKENNELIFEKPDKKLIVGDILFERKILWMEIESIGKESNTVIEDNKNILRETIEHEAIEIADAVIELSKLIRQIENLRLSDEYYTERKKRAFDKGDKIVKDIGAFIEKI